LKSGGTTSKRSRSKRRHSIVGDPADGDEAKGVSPMPSIGEDMPYRVVAAV
jgi:hypothetical protein